ncbi:MAG: hypothetical protein V1826_00625 [bacterium]
MNRYWFQSKSFKITLAAVAVIAVVLLILFGKDLMKLFEKAPSKAGEAITIDSATDWNEGTFTNAVVQDDKLVIMPPAPVVP